MKKGDVVMFTDTGRYAKWFLGQLAIVESVTASVSATKQNKKTLHCRVRWIKPVPYFGKFSTISDFSADKFSSFEST